MHIYPPPWRLTSQCSIGRPVQDAPLSARPSADDEAKQQDRQQDQCNDEAGVDDAVGQKLIVDG